MILENLNQERAKVGVGIPIDGNSNCLNTIQELYSITFFSYSRFYAILEKL